MHAAEKATEILKEVKEAQDILRKQKERNKLEAEVSTCVCVQACLYKEYMCYVVCHH